jgi:hypothetical protein
MKELAISVLEKVSELSDSHGAALAPCEAGVVATEERAMPRKRATNGARSRSAREARAKREARYKPMTPADVDMSSPAHSLSARELYLREKARRANRHQADPDHPLAQAKRQYHALLAAEAEAGRGGRPKKMVAAKKAAAKAFHSEEDD